MFINSQTGKDFFLFEQNKELISIAEAIAEQTVYLFFYETPRGKFSFAAHVTKQFLQKIPSLKLTLDIYHGCAVAETLLADQIEAVEMALLHTQHLHARFGSSQVHR